MADVAKMLCGPLLLTGSSVVLYTVPASTTTIVRNIHIANTSSSNASFNLSINGSASTLANTIYNTFTVAPFSAFDWSGFMVLATAATLQGLASATNALNITVSGIESA